MTNNSGANFENANLKLLAGDVRRAPQPTNGIQMRMMDMAAGERETGFAEEQFADYHLYTLQRPATVRNREIKQLSLLEALSVPVKRKLVLDAMRAYPGYRPNEGTIGSGPMKPLVRIELVNNKASHLGMPLPMGTVKVFQRDKSGSLQMLGEDRIQHTPKDEKVTLDVGRAFDIVAERKRTNFKWIGDRKGCTETFEIELRNRKETEETVYVIERHHFEHRIFDNNMPYNKLDSDTIEFVVKLKPGEVKKVVYTVDTRW